MRSQTTTLDEYSSQRDVSPDFVKIDVENAEYDVLLGMARIIKESRPIITVQVGDMGIAGVPSSNELISHLCRQGYTAHEFDGTGIRKHQIKDRYSLDNLLFLPAG